MKTTLAIILGSIAIMLSSASFAWSNSCSSGGCDGNDCDFNQTICQCVDPACTKPWGSDCMDRATCCEAFGNIGARDD